MRLSSWIAAVALALLPASAALRADSAAGEPPTGDESVAERVAGVYSDGTIQDRLPGNAATAARGEAVGRRLPAVAGGRSRRGGRLGGPIAWTVLAVVLALGLIWLTDSLAQRRQRSLAVPAAAAEGGRRRARDRPQTDPEALADAGRYSEAAHELLLRAIERIAAHAPHGLSPALTGREVAKKSGLEALGRRAFDRLLGASERFLFGGEPLGSDDYTDCRAAYEELDHSLAGRA